MKKSFLALAFLMVSALGFSQDVDSVDNQTDVETVVPVYKYPKMDIDFKFYLPSALGMVNGNNAYLQLRENYEDVTSCSNFIFETRGDILSVGKVSFAWGVGFNGYVEQKTVDRNYTSFGLSLGAGLYYAPFSSNYPCSMHGLSLFVYPMYEMPLFRDSDEKFVNWKCAVDVGLNAIFFDGISIYPYMRDIFAWTDKGFKVGIDFGVAIGLYLPDNNYRKAHQ